MFNYLNKIIDNEVLETNLDSYSVIIGTKPSKGARSPKLWNKVYKYEEKKIRMVPLDVQEDKLEQLFNYLRKDKQCLGGAVAVPFKEKVYNLIKGNVDEEIKMIGAVNCFYRLASGPLINEFTGTNTDGEAALEPIKKQLIQNDYLNIGVLGFGGAGKAIVAFLLRYFSNKHNIKIFNRSPTNFPTFNKVRVNSYSLNDLETYLPNLDLLINATSAGHIENINTTPISAELLKKANEKIVVYDIIYDPLKTTLLKNSEDLGLRTINGLSMNIFQAVLAYSYTNPTNLSLQEIFKTMN